MSKAQVSVKHYTREELIAQLEALREEMRVCRASRDEWAIQSDIDATLFLLGGEPE